MRQVARSACRCALTRSILLLAFPLFIAAGCATTPAPESSAPVAAPAPTASPPAPAPQNTPVVDLDDALARIPAYDLGQDPAPMEFIIAEIMASPGDAIKRAHIAERLAALMAGECTYECKRFAANQLYIIATEVQVPVITPLLTDPALSHLARYALEKIPGAAADAAFLDALHAATGVVKVGLINSIGARRQTGAVLALIDALGASDAPVAAAAARALGAIGGSDAVKALNKARLSAPADLEPALFDALLVAADRYLAEDAPRKAEVIYEDLYRSLEPSHVRLAALRGLVDVRGEKSLPLVLDALHSDDSEWRAVALGYARRVQGTAATALYTDALATLPPDNAAALIAILADRGDTAARPAITAAASAENPQVRAAALTALATLGDASSAALLADAAAASDGDVQQAARASLDTLAAPGTDDAILARLQDASGPLKLELLRTLAERRTPGAMGVLLDLTRSAEPPVRDEAFRSVGKLASAEDLPALVERLIASDPAARDAAEAALVTALRRQPGGAARTDAVLRSLPRVSDPAVRSAIARALGAVAEPAALPALRELSGDPDEAVQSAAVAAIASWTTPEPLPDLLALAKDAARPARAAAALEGYVKLLRLPANRFSAADAIARYSEVLSLARTPTVKRAALAGLSETQDAAALPVIERHLRDPELANEALVAAEKIRRRTYTATASHMPEDAPKAIDGDIGTRWDTRTPQQPGQWFQVDLGRPSTLRGVVLDTSRSENDFPRACEVYVFNDPAKLGKPVAAVAAGQTVSSIEFAPVTGRYVRVIQTATTDYYFWSIHELRILPAL